jgi:LysM repeat protein
MRSGRPISLFLVLALIGAISGCSSSPTSSNEGNSEYGATESGADAVGSIPEDMLAAEETPMGDSAPAENLTAADDTSTPVETATQPSDPFADLTEAEATAEESVTTTGETAAYTVKAGDTLMKIAFTIYGDVDRWKDLQEWNRGKLKSVSQLRVGMSLTYETPTTSFSPEQLAHSYLIKKGDTLAGIADEVYGRKMKYKKLQNYNRRLIKNPNRIFAGFTIFYDITEQEMAEAEARRKERMAGGGMDSAPSSDGFNMVPSSISPPESSSDAKPIAIAPPPGAIAPPSGGPVAVPAPASSAK